MAEQWRILVVEGEENLNWNIVNALQRDGYLVLGLTSGAEAIRALWSVEYDVVICNQQIPDGTGFDLLQWMRAYSPKTRMMLLCTPGAGVSRSQALEMGVASYLEKPLDLHTLKAELRRLLYATGFSASLDSFDLLDVIQIVNMSRKSIALVVSTGLEEQGTLRFQMGELIWAEYGTLRGEEAFFALAAHKNGTVVHRQWNEQITPNVAQPLARLIFQALQYRSKYAEYQQMSSELEAIRPNTVATSTPLPVTLQEVGEEDRPFQFVTEDLSFEKAVINSSQSSSASMASISSTNARLPQVGGGLGIVKNTEPDMPHQQDIPEKAWWEPTETVAHPQLSGGMPAVTGNTPGSTFPSNGKPSLEEQLAIMGQESTLPSWLTDQPTYLDLPVLRGNTGQIPVTPQERSPAQPGHSLPASAPPSPIPAARDLPQQGRSEWSPSSAPMPAETGPQRGASEEFRLAVPQRIVKPNIAKQPTGSLRPTTAEWQGPAQQLPPQGRTAQPGAVPPANLPEFRGEAMPGTMPSRQSGSTPIPPARDYAPVLNEQTEIAPAITLPLPQSAAPGQGQNEAVEAMPATSAPSPQRTTPTSAGQSKRNQPALTAALQTFGYSVAGFVAAAVMGLDGVPIAQVSMDETDMSPLCTHLGNVVQGALQALEKGHGENYEHTVITSRTHYILLRPLTQTQEEIFQVLLTTRATNPAESLEVMANVEAALTAALQ